MLTSFTQAATGSSGQSGAVASFMQQIFNTLASAVVAFLQALGCIPLLKWTIGIIAQVILGSIIILAALILAVISVGELVGVMLTGILMVAIGVAVGPLFVACAVCRWSSDFFKGWLKFLLGASAYQMIISVVLTLVSSLLTAAQTQISSVKPRNGGFDVRSFDCWASRLTWHYVDSYPSFQRDSTNREFIVRRWS